MVKMNTTTWHPDTCKCVIQYTWDSDLPVEQRVHTYSNTIKDCPEHSGLGNTIYDVILDENQRKNKVYGELIKISGIGEDVIQDDGTTVKQLVKGVTYDWQFDVDRNLEVMVIGANLKVGDKNILQSFADSAFGTGKVKVL